MDNFELGWEEWLALPDLGLPAIKAKIDTGARTSALHAHVIEAFGPTDKPQVRFLMHPDPKNPLVEVTCSARVIDRREVTSSNRSEEHTSELQSRSDLVCRLLLEKKKL